jgi:hypothetical protein
MSQNQTHEQGGHSHSIPPSSDRSFCMVMAGAFLVIGLFMFWSTSQIHYWVFALSLIFLVVGLLIPALFRPLNKAWLHFGMLLQKVVNPMILGLLFFGIFLPVGLVLRLSGKDPLYLKKPSGKSCWVARASSPPPEKMKLQF